MEFIVGAQSAWCIKHPESISRAYPCTVDEVLPGNKQNKLGQGGKASTKTRSSKRGEGRVRQYCGEEKGK